MLQSIVDMRKKVKIKDIIPNKENPRFISDNKFEKLVQSIKDFPEMLEKRPLVVDEDMVVLGGNMRLKALQKAGLKEITIDIAEGWTEEQKKQFIIKDNVGFGQWDWDVLANTYDLEELNSWGLDLEDFPEMLEKRPLVVDEDMVVLGGNMRLKALQKAGLKEITIDIAEGWTEEQKKEFIIKDNVGFGEWDWDTVITSLSFLVVNK